MLADQGSSVDVLGSSTWLELARTLRPDRRPVVMVDDPRRTIAETIAFGGVGDTSLHYGLAASSVIEVELLGPNGPRVVTRDDELFHYLLCGGTKLGAIGRVRLETMRRPPLLIGHVVTWNTLDDAIRACVVIPQKKLYEVVRPTLHWTTPASVSAIVGNFVDVSRSDDAGLELLRPNASAPLDAMEWFAQIDQPAAPAVGVHRICDFALPLTSTGLAGWNAIEAFVRRGLVAFLSDGSAMTPLVPEAHLPLAPIPPNDGALFVSLRPRFPSPDEAAVFAPVLQEIMHLVVEHRGRITLDSLVPDKEFLEAQFGHARVSRWGELQAGLGG